MIQQANAGGSKGHGNPEHRSGRCLRRSSRGNRPDTGPGARPERELTWIRWVRC